MISNSIHLQHTCGSPNLLKVALLGAISSLSLTAHAVPRKTLQKNKATAAAPVLKKEGKKPGKNQGVGHCDHGQGNGYGHDRNHDDSCGCADENHERDEDRDDLMDPHSCDGGDNDGDNDGGGSSRTVKLPGKLDLSKIRPHSRVVPQGFDLSLGEAKLAPPTITNTFYFAPPHAGPYDQICPEGQAVYSLRSHYRSSRIQCAPIQDQATTPSFNEWGSGLSVHDALQLHAFELNRGVGKVLAHITAGAITHYSYRLDSGAGSINSDSSVFCPRNEVLVGVRSTDSRFPFNRRLGSSLIAQK